MGFFGGRCCMIESLLERSRYLKRRGRPLRARRCCANRRNWRRRSIPRCGTGCTRAGARAMSHAAAHPRRPEAAATLDRGTIASDVPGSAGSALARDGRRRPGRRDGRPRSADRPRFGDRHRRHLTSPPPVEAGWGRAGAVTGTLTTPVLPRGSRPARNARHSPSLVDLMSHRTWAHSASAAGARRHVDRRGRPQGVARLTPVPGGNGIGAVR